MFKMEFATDNAAFKDEGMAEDERDDDAATRAEVARILRRVADSIARSADQSGRTMDLNGNSVGDWSLS